MAEELDRAHGSETSGIAKSESWDPSSLSLPFLIALSVLLTSLAIATIVILRISNQSRGFPILTNVSYSWTYGPTAIMVLIIGMWDQVDYWSKALQPWRELKNGPKQADRTVLLDYISPPLPVNLWKALRRRHGTLAVVITNGLLLNVITIASTGLLEPEQTQMTFQNITLATLTEFSAAHYPWVLDGAFETSINYEEYALLTENLPMPNCTQASFAYQCFEIPSNSTINATDGVLKATVDAFKPQAECQGVNITITGAANEPLDNATALLYLNMSASSDLCLSSFETPFLIEHHLIHERPPDLGPRQIYGQLSSLNCSEQGSWFELGLVFFFDVYYNQSSRPRAVVRVYEESVDSGVWGLQVMPAAAVVCNISYSIIDAQVTYDLAQLDAAPTVEIDNQADGNRSRRTVEDFDGESFAERLLWDVGMAANIAGNYLSDGRSLEYPTALGKMMKIVTNASYETFLTNITEMAAAASTILEYVGVRVATTFAVVNASAPLQGEIQTVSQRLRVSPIAAGLMIGGFFLAATCAFWVAFRRPRRVVPYNIGSIEGLARVMLASPAFQDVLAGCAHMPIKSSEKALQPYEFQSVPFGAGSLQIFSRQRSSKETTQQTETDRTQAPMVYWRPLPLRPIVFTIISALPLAIIVTLEVLQHLSSRSDGIIAISNPNALLTTLGVRLVPATVMMSVALLFGALKFNLCLLAPFQRLKRGNAKFSDSLRTSLVSKPAPYAFGYAIQQRHWAAALALLGAFLGNFLTILVSGLYTVENSAGPAVASLQLMDQFNTAWSDSALDDGGAAVLLSGFQGLNLSLPAWTDSELVFPKLQLSNSDMKLINDTKEPAITVLVPAMRADLNCSIIPESDQTVFVDPLNPDDLTLNGSAPINNECSTSASSIQWSSNYGIVADDPLTWLGQLWDLHVGLGLGNQLSSGESQPAFQPDNPPGCPSLALIFGNFSQYGFENLEAAASDFTSMVCYQLMTEVQAEVTFNIPDFTVISASPVESTVRYLISGPNGQTAFPYRPQVHMDLEVAVWKGNYTYGGLGGPDTLTEARNAAYNIDGFFTLLLSAKGAPLPDELRGKGNQMRLVDAVRSVYRRYMAQVANAKMRVDLGSNTTNSRAFSGSYTNSNRGILRQNIGSKIALQAVLGVMFFCGIAAYFLADIGSLLACSPGSITATASLLAGSLICKVQIEGAVDGVVDWDTEFWREQFFSLGWWETETEGETRFGIDAGQASQYRYGL
ncbi:hypothetical protein GQ53DRAFT_889115 [Thozetella sp. PMI_491]|nr:hypothetical protein GQ53DRAFT_889115 [Thozetella sp. PMI_491]